MDKFISLHTIKNEIVLCNVSKILYIGEAKKHSVVYIDEFVCFTVKETIEEIFALLT